MTHAAIRLASPTAPERALLKLAEMLTTVVARRREVRAERRESRAERGRVTGELVRGQGRAQDPAALNIALLALGSRPRR